jgi:hypothetical protein
MSVDEIRAAILAGAVVRMGFAPGPDGRNQRVWWIDDPYAEIDDAAMQVAMRGENGGPLLVEAFDSLFRWPGNSQTWLSIYA